ncbi:MAG: ABC transporter permease subunit [Acidobacteria bacterium]|nr:ABC transporter permease subunit [Acidobacteriota bacterium]
MNVDRIGALIGKELREFRSSPAAIVPVVLVVVLCTTLPFLIVVLIPALTGQPLTADRMILQIVAAARTRTPALASLPPLGAAQAFLFQQFLLLFLVAPIVGAVSLAAYSVVGEKQGRTLEPLLTTPLSTGEMLIAKVLASFLPSLAIELAGLAVYLLLAGALAAPGVAAALVNARTAVLVGLVGPFASLTALQVTIAVSSRVNDPRSAQQIAVLIVVPLVVLLVGQIAGAFVVTTGLLAAVAAALAAAWGLLILFSVALFERETILTRWK